MLDTDILTCPSIITLLHCTDNKKLRNERNPIIGGNACERKLAELLLNN
jgi:hypothetical protein